VIVRVHFASMAKLAGASMMVVVEGISDSAIANHWINAYGTSNCQTAVAVALAESGGDCSAKGYNSNSIDRGLWQINDYWHPECSDSCAYDCACNARCAVNVWKSSGWGAWATWSNNLHSKYMTRGATACGYFLGSEEPTLDSPALTYSPSAAVSWSGQHCNDNDGSQCAEFASNAIKAGGHANGCWSTYVPTLDTCLKNAGWKQTSWPCSAGSVVIWYDNVGPYHAAISRGSGLIDQHNPNRCSSSGSWGTNYCRTPPSFLTSNDTVIEDVVV